MANEVSKAPYNFIELDRFVLDRCSDENEILNHDRYSFDLNTGYIEYEIETITPLHISKGVIKDRKNSNNKNLTKNESLLFKNPEGIYAIPGNTIRGMTRFNASIFSFSSVINRTIDKEDIENQRFYYRTYASEDKVMREWYKKKTGLKVVRKENYTYSVLTNVEAGYIQRRGKDYIIIPAVKLGGKSYLPIHEYDLRSKNVKGVNYLYNDDNCELKREDYKNKDILAERRNRDYKPYMVEAKYNTDGKRAFIDNNGKYTGYLVNSGYIDVKGKIGKVHHYLILEEDKNSKEIPVSNELAELYTDDMKYTHKQNPNSDSAYGQYEYYELSKKGEKKPIFYINDNNKLIFGFTPYLRLPAEGNIHGGIPETHRNYSGRDFVDSIFGWKNFRTKVSFLDALCVSTPVQEVKYDMVLGQPKPSWYKGYIKQEKEGELESYCTDNYKIRGRKFYWLKEGADLDAMKSNLPAPDKKDKVSTTMYCHKEGTKFKGKLRFENLSNEELGLLIYSLKQGDTEGYFNIGMGKSYGLGKCKITIKQLVISDIKEKYMSFAGKSEINEDIDKYITCFKDYVKKFYKVKDLNDIRSYREYLLSKTFMKNTETRYMKVKEFKNKAELPTIEEVIAGKKLSDKMGKDNNVYKAGSKSIYKKVR